MLIANFWCQALTGFTGLGCVFVCVWGGVGAIKHPGPTVCH